LVKSIAERHGGSVECLAQPGGGAVFVVKLPIWIPKIHSFSPTL
jgi:signal transduction histidine kinase